MFTTVPDHCHHYCLNRHSTFICPSSQSSNSKSLCDRASPACRGLCQITGSLAMSGGDHPAPVFPHEGLPQLDLPQTTGPGRRVQRQEVYFQVRDPGEHQIGKDGSQNCVCCRADHHCGQPEFRAVRELVGGHGGIHMRGGEGAFPAWSFSLLWLRTAPGTFTWAHLQVHSCVRMVEWVPSKAPGQKGKDEPREGAVR